MILIRRCIQYANKSTNKPLFTKTKTEGEKRKIIKEGEGKNTITQQSIKQILEGKISQMAQFQQMKQLEKTENNKQILKPKVPQMTSFKLMMQLENAKTSQTMLDLLQSNEGLLNDVHLTAALKYYEYMPHSRKLHLFLVNWVHKNWKQLKLGERGNNSIAAVVWHLRSQPLLKQQIINVTWQNVFPYLTDQQFTMVVNGLMMSRWDTQIFKLISAKKPQKSTNQRKLFTPKPFPRPKTMAQLLQIYISPEFNPAFILSIWRHYIKYHPQENISNFMGKQMGQTVVAADFSKNLPDYAYLLQVYVSEHEKIDAEVKTRIQSIIAKTPQKESNTNKSIYDGQQGVEQKKDGKKVKGLEAQHFCIFAESWKKVTKITQVVKHQNQYRYFIQLYNNILEIKLTFLRQLSNSYYYFIMNYSMDKPSLEKTGLKYIEICQLFIDEYRNKKIKQKQQESREVNNTFRQKALKKYDLVAERIDSESIRLFFPQIINALKSNNQDRSFTGIIAKIGHCTLEVLQIYQEEGILYLTTYNEYFYSQILYGALLISKHLKQLGLSQVFDEGQLKLMSAISQYALNKVSTQNLGKFSSCLVGLDIKTAETCKYVKQKYQQMSKQQREEVFGKHKDKQKCFMVKYGSLKCVCIQQ